MAAKERSDNSPDLTEGVTLADFGDRKMLRGRVGKKPVLLARVGDDIHAIGATCTHYQGRLDRGALEGDAVRCPLHHALFSLHSGEALNAPAFNPVAVWKVEREGERIFVREEKPREDPPARAKLPDDPARVVIVGGGAAGFAAAEMLRRRGYDGGITMISAEADAPLDRPNLSKDYLDGSAPEDWMPLKGASFYESQEIDLHLATEVAQIDTDAREVVTADGARHGYDRLLVATGAEPVVLPIPGPIGRMSLPCARSPTAARSWRGPRAPGARWCWGRASSGSRRRRRCASAGSKWMWSRRMRSLCSGCSGQHWAHSFAACMRTRARSFTWRPRSPRSVPTV